MKTETTRERILNCALQLFSERGYEAVGVQEITEQSGITKPTLYYYFGSKEGLFSELLRIAYAELNQRLASACCYEPRPNEYTRDIFPVLVEVAKTYFAFAKGNPDFYRMSLALTFAPPTSQATILSEADHKTQYVLLTRLFEQIADTHTNLRGKEPRLATSFIALINAQVGFWYHGAAEIDADNAHALVKLFMHGIFA